jgi:hypothetical protein
MRDKVVRRVFAALLLLVTSLAWADPGQLPTSLFTGCWRSQGGDQVLRFEKDRIFVWEGGKFVGRLLAWGIEGYEAGSIRTRVAGQLQTWPLTLQEGLLRIQMKEGLREYRHDPEVPTELTVIPVTLGRSADLPPERIQAIQAELAKRLEEDQAVRKVESRRSEMARVGAANTSFLRSLVQEIGWIDARRFGRQAAGYATILLKHSLDMALVTAAMPFVEQDWKGTGQEALLFAIVYDELRIELGQKQRYGTQLGEDSQGQPLVLPVESLEEMEAYRKDLGLQPLAEYLAEASKVLYDGKPIRMPRADE